MFYLYYTDTRDPLIRHLIDKHQLRFKLEVAMSALEESQRRMEDLGLQRFLAFEIEEVKSKPKSKGPRRLPPSPEYLLGLMIDLGADEHPVDAWAVHNSLYRSIMEEYRIARQSHKDFHYIPLIISVGAVKSRLDRMSKEGYLVRIYQRAGLPILYKISGDRNDRNRA